MTFPKTLVATLFLANLFWSSEGIAQNFSCTFGRGACLDARIALRNRDARAEIEETERQIHKVETAIEPRFQEHFVAAIT